MGEYAEMILDGLMCQGCGELMGDPGGSGRGYPGYCAGCARTSRDIADHFVSRTPTEPPPLRTHEIAAWLVLSGQPITDLQRMEMAQAVWQHVNKARRKRVRQAHPAPPRSAP